MNGIPKVEYYTYMFNSFCKPDNVLLSLLKREEIRQKTTINLIASENFAPEGVLKLLGSELTNKYSEGYPGARYYPGNEYCDQIEIIAQKRAIKLFGLSAKNWHVNVQPYSGAIANLAIYSSVLNPGDKILSMGLSSGGHLSHGFKVSLSGKLYKVVNYNVNENYDINYKEIEFLAKKIKPKMIVSGASAYPKAIDFEKIGKIAVKVGAYHLADISHYAGLVSAKKYPSPFKSADFVMMTTHKSLFGPRAAIVYVNENSKIAKRSGVNLARALDKAIFPGLQGGPHNNVIAGIAWGLKISVSLEAKKYFRQVLKNSKTLCRELKKYGFEIVGGKTESHMFLVKVTGLGINGFEAERKLEKAGILANRNTILGDASAIRPSAIRIGTYAVTNLGMKGNEMKAIAGFIKIILIDGEKIVTVKKEVLRLAKRYSFK